MSMSEKRSNRENRRLAPVLEPIEGRILLSSVVGAHLPDPARLVAEAARTRRLAISGKLNGNFSINTEATPVQGLVLVMINANGNSGNSRVGPVTITTSFVTTQTLFNSLATTKATVKNLSMQMTAPGGTISATGTLSITAMSRRSPFRFIASITEGTGQFTGATGNFTIQGTSFSLMSGRLAGSLRGTIVTHA
jgi:hypothetical protein